MKKQKTKENISIKNVNSPGDVKNMTEKELEYLAVSAREFLIDSISKTGGHLASNLGVVELTLGLHYVFDSPKDKIIWDVGHQAYVHKMITGRRNAFDALRKTGGLSGFPKRSESDHDIYDTGHSSTSIPAAIGMATARDLNGDNYNVVAVIGDGSMTGGPAFEALNNVAQIKSKIIIVLNDNGMSISKNIGGLSEHLGRLRSSTGYQQAKEKVKDKLDQVPLVGSSLKSVIGTTKENLKYLLLSEGVLFEELGLTYLGPYDGHSIKDIILALNHAKRAEGPVVVHFITKKGKGYKPAESDPNKFHGVGSFDPETGETLSDAVMTYSEVFGDALYELSKVNPKVTAITAAMCDATGLGKMQTESPDRVFDVGIAEAYGVIFAAGQAISGLHPYVAIYSSFLQRAYDEIMEDVCMQGLPVTFAIDRAGIVGSDGETHHGIFDLSYLLPMPGMTIYAPSDAVQLRRMIEISSKINTPSAIRYPRGEAYMGNMTGEFFDGKNIRLSSGKDIEIYAVGTMLGPSLKAAEILREGGLSVGVIDIALVRDGSEEIPTLETYTVDPNKMPKLVVTVEDNVKAGGFGEFFDSLLLENGLGNSIRITNLAWPDKFIEHGSVDDLYAKYHLDAQGISDSILHAYRNRNAGPSNNGSSYHPRIRDNKEKEERMQILQHIFGKE